MATFDTFWCFGLFCSSIFHRFDLENKVLRLKNSPARGLVDLYIQLVDFFVNSKYVVVLYKYEDVLVYYTMFSDIIACMNMKSSLVK